MVGALWVTQKETPKTEKRIYEALIVQSAGETTSLSSSHVIEFVTNIVWGLETAWKESETSSAVKVFLVFFSLVRLIGPLLIAWWIMGMARYSLQLCSITKAAHLVSSTE